MKKWGINISGTFLRRLVFLLVCALAWYLGQLVANVLPPEALSLAASSIHSVLERPVLRAPPPKRQKCDHWTPCPPEHFAYRILSGANTMKHPKICFEDELLMGEEKGNTGRGMNVAIVNAISGKFLNAESFDMWEGDFAGKMLQFMKDIPQNSIVLMATHDEGSTRLSSDIKTEITNLGSKEIQKIAFRSNWVFIGAKGFVLPTNIRSEQINHSDQAKNRYSGWPAEVQIEGCIPRIYQRS
ncbi:protein FAM3B-like isoform X1 [Erpetoichthys calabaricus]|uniref:protein FAM3B-like isoform X1 n=1 Tax=Erpetoichthys calabaricus TaxID=27687 RepID=UPI00109EFA7E|nr:protein FAM3B-like isoform X1 [Erpetoichthys calabaricus]